eukprot:6197805-Pleurochrysis_carterae.AAC.5
MAVLYCEAENERSNHHHQLNMHQHTSMNSVCAKIGAFNRRSGTRREQEGSTQENRVRSPGYPALERSFAPRHCEIWAEGDGCLWSGVALRPDKQASTPRPWLDAADRIAHA